MLKAYEEQMAYEKSFKKSIFIKFVIEFKFDRHEPYKSVLDDSIRNLFLL